MLTQKADPVLIIGAGPAGLAIAGRLWKLGIPFEVLERTQRVGSAWHGHYDRLHLHTVNELSHLPHLPFPDDYPLYVSRDQLCQYLEDYARKMSIHPRFGVEVSRIERDAGQWRITTAAGKQWTGRDVVVATGVNRVPYQPRYPGEQEFRGDILHSRAYQRVDPFRGGRTLVVGMGNTGAEIALDFAEHELPVAISVRGPVNIVPRDAFGNPTQLTARKLDRLPNWLSDRLGLLVQRLTVGKLDKYGLTRARMAPARQLRELGKTPVIDLGTVKMIKAGKIRVLPGIERFDTEGVWLADGRHYACETVIYCTGYRPRLAEFLQGLEGFLDPHGCPRRPIGKGELAGLYFLGFDNYTPGGILGVINRDSQKIAAHIAARSARKEAFSRLGNK